jgi:hypothetical protein
MRASCHASRPDTVRDFFASLPRRPDESRTLPDSELGSGPSCYLGAVKPPRRHGFLLASIVFVACSVELAPLEKRSANDAGGSGNGPPAGGSAGGGESGAGGALGGAAGKDAGAGCYDPFTIDGDFDGKPGGCYAPDKDLCLCEGCESTVCEDNGGVYADCVCPVCWGSQYCSPDYCVDNGLCDPLNEGCYCADCWWHPACAGYR